MYIQIVFSGNGSGLVIELRYAFECINSVTVVRALFNKVYDVECSRQFILY